MKLSIVSPIYKGEKMLHELVSRIEDSVKTITNDYEIILVNDQSPDNSWTVIKCICAADKKVKGVNLSRNFGQHYAISAGISLATGDWVVIMDCDLQDRPENIPLLYKKAQEGYNVIRAKRIARKDKFVKQLSGKIFHLAFDILSGSKTDSSLSNMGMYNKVVIDEINRIPEQTKDMGRFVEYLGYRTSYIEVEHSERLEGSSSYNFNKLLKLAYCVIISNSNRPLKASIFLGFFMAFVAILLALYNVFAKYCGINTVPGFTDSVPKSVSE